MAQRTGLPLSLNILAETLMVGAGHVGWALLRAVNWLVPERRYHAKWAPAPALKSRERSAPPLGLPRETDSLCPECVKQVRAQIVDDIRRVAEHERANGNGAVQLNGNVNGNGSANGNGTGHGQGNGREIPKPDLSAITGAHPGEIKATILERDGQVLMVKTCPEHGTFEDVLAHDVKFWHRIEGLFGGRDFRIAPDELHDHGTSSMKYGRGAVLTVDLTNRCNMMCDPCFMDANQVGYVHELEWAEIKELLDNAVSIKPRRQLSVQFSGGEPTLSPHFLKAVAYAKEVGFFSVQAATNGIKFAQDPEFCAQARDAGLRFVYLQFDGVDPEATALRGVGNILEVKQRALDNLYNNGITATLVVTVCNNLNNEQIGPIYDFARRNLEKIHSLAFQPVSFTGRDEDLSDEKRAEWRYTNSHLAHDFARQTGISEPMRDWFPLSASSPFSDLNDLMRGADSEWGSLRCGCHPNCGVATFLMVDMQTKEATPIPRFVNVDRMLEDAKQITDWGRSAKWTKFAVACSFLRNWRPRQKPEGLKLKELLDSFDSYTGSRMSKETEAKRFRFGMMAIMGMWFQDLWTYDFRRTEMCIIPYATQQGEISFCAYNTGVGWRKVVEEIHKVASVKDWFADKGRHEVYAGGREVEMGRAAEPHPQYGPRAEDAGWAVQRKT